MAFKIYTKTGDSGSTALLGGTRVSKSHIRIDAYGNIDELNAHLGLLLVQCQLNEKNVTKLLSEIQDRLFTIGSALACDPEKNSKIQIPEISDSDVKTLERSIDSMEQLLPKLTNFVLPGGNVASGQAHVARCICRRAERSVVHLIEHQPQPAGHLILSYLNRLSDYLFVLSRYLLHLAGIEDRIWAPGF